MICVLLQVGKLVAMLRINIYDRLMKNLIKTTLMMKITLNLRKMK